MDILDKKFPDKFIKAKDYDFLLKNKQITNFIFGNSPITKL